MPLIGQTWEWRGQGYGRWLLIDCEPYQDTANYEWIGRFLGGDVRNLVGREYRLTLGLDDVFGRSDEWEWVQLGLSFCANCENRFEGDHYLCRTCRG